MALTDNRTQLNDCQDDTQTFATSGGALGTNTLAGNTIITPNSVQTKHSNAYEDTYTSGDSAGATFNLNLSDQTIYIAIKDNGYDVAEVVGAGIVLGDGTDRIGYSAGGSNALGLPYQKVFNVFKLDGSDAAANPGTADVGHHVFAGTEANLNFAAITIVGYGGIHNAKAQGNVANVFISGIYHIANGSYAATVSGGTSGTPETMADLVGDDETVGAGMFSNPIGSTYYIFAPTEWGDAGTGTSAFAGTDESWQYVGDNGGGRAVGATHFPMRLVGNATGTNIFRQTRVVNQNVGTRCEFDWSDANFDEIALDGCSWNSFGVITAPGQDVDKNADNQTFNDCDQFIMNAMNMDTVTFNGAFDANGAVLLDTSGDSNNAANLIFNSDGTGHAVEISVAGTYDLDNWTYTGYGADGTTDAAIYISVNAAVTINIQNGGDTPTIRHSGTAPTINNNVTVAVNGVAEGTSVKVIAYETVGTITSGDVLSEGFADSTGEYSFQLNYESAFNPSGLDALIRARNQGIAVSCQYDDNGTFTEQTAEANSVATNDIILAKLDAVEDQDFCYFGHNEQFDAIKVDVSTAGVGDYEMVVEYWTGSVWSTVTSDISRAIDPFFQELGYSITAWDMPSNWATTTINSIGPLYFARVKWVEGASFTTAPLGRTAMLDVTRYLPIPQSGVLVRTITSSGLTATLSQAVDSISIFDTSG